MRKVLIITYYWPPGGGGGVMRWLKMSKYLFQDTDWEPIIFCPDQANYLIKDESLKSQIPKGLQTLKNPILEPNDILSKFGFKKILKNVSAGGIGKLKNESSLKNKFIVWVRSNLFVPDARSFWVKPSIRKIERELKNLNIDAIISTGPPHSMHLIALKLKEKYNIPWIADFRDPWTFIDFFEDLSLTTWARKKHFELESKVVKQADKVITVSQSWADTFKDLYQVDVGVINNGFDPKDFEGISDLKKDSNFTICHIGSLNKDRSSPVFWESIAELTQKDASFRENLKIKIIGAVSDDLFSILEEFKILDVVEIINHLPHAEVIKVLGKSSISLLLINKTANKGGIIPGKLYEYLAVKNPILCIGNREGNSAKIIEETHTGITVDFDDKDKMCSVILDYYHKFRTGKLDQTNSPLINKYSRRNLAFEYAAKLNEIVK